MAGVLVGLGQIKLLILWLFRIRSFVVLSAALKAKIRTFSSEKTFTSNTNAETLDGLFFLLIEPRPWKVCKFLDVSVNLIQNLVANFFGLFI